ncbi:unnamed protein product, partial [Linum tenue]
KSERLRRALGANCSDENIVRIPNCFGELHQLQSELRTLQYIPSPYSSSSICTLPIDEVEFEIPTFPNKSWCFTVTQLVKQLHTIRNQIPSMDNENPARG